MISVGVDVSKGKSTVCILKPYGEIVCSPFEVQHVEKDLDGLDGLLKKLDGEIRVVMEATGIYHLPVLTFLEEKGYFVSVINPFAMKKYAKDNSIRGAKTDKLDSTIIANYGIDKWFKLQKHEGDEEKRTRAAACRNPGAHCSGNRCSAYSQHLHARLAQ